MVQQLSKNIIQEKKNLKVKHKENIFSTLKIERDVLAKVLLIVVPMANHLKCEIVCITHKWVSKMDYNLKDTPREEYITGCYLFGGMHVASSILKSMFYCQKK